MLFAVLSGFFLSILLAFSGGKLRGWLSLLPGILPAALFVYFLSYLPDIAGDGLFFHYPWVPSAGIDLSFRLDGLSMLFSLMITGVGALVFFYTSAYLKDHHHLDRFYGYLGMFMASMLGLVLSDNLVAMFIFWELTSISSFFLIGFNNDSEGSRKAARVSFAITGGGGLILMVGVLLLGYLGQTFSIHELTGMSDLLRSGALYGWIIALIFAGALTKSAQFPFHFWLPAAMQAPTPVSTYLHSATMVKAGIYLLARLSPVLGDHIYWNTTLTVIGAVTMLYAAIHTLFRTDMKSILAYSTISALGIMVFLIGIGSRESLLALSVFILVHALYKATLFLVTGTVDHATGSRDVTRLSGLRKVMMPVAIAALLAAIANAGLPFSFGFIGKEIIYESTLLVNDWGYLLTALAIAANVCLFYAGFVVGLKPFIGKAMPNSQTFAKPAFLLWFPPLLLGVLGIVLGVFPEIISEPLIGKVHQSIFTASLGTPHLKLWHGFGLVLMLSGLTVLLGTTLYFLLKPSLKIEGKLSLLNRASPSVIIEKLWIYFVKLAGNYTRLLQNGFLRYYIMIILFFAVLMLGYRFLTEVDIVFDFDSYSPISFYEGVVGVLMILSILLVVTSRSRLNAVVAMGVVGFSMSLTFMNFGAPDLAMTQFTIDTLTVVLFVLVLYNLPKYLNYSDPSARLRDSLIGLSFGALITLLAIEVIQQPLNRETSEYFAKNAYLFAKGKNIVNVILVDFRAVDTLGEITVLSVAAIGVYSLLKLHIVYKKKEKSS